MHMSACLVTQSCPTLCDSMDYSPPGSSVHGILLARTLEWVAMPSYRESSRPRDQALLSFLSCIGKQDFYHQCHLGSPQICIYLHVNIYLHSFTKSLQLIHEIKMYFFKRCIFGENVIFLRIFFLMKLLRNSCKC